MTEIVLLADESGAKGYAGTPERFCGEAGVFAGVLIPADMLDSFQTAMRGICSALTASGKLHVTDLTSSVQQSELRASIVGAIEKYQLICTYEAIYVQGFHRWFELQRKQREKLPKVSRSGIKISGNSTAEELLHEWLFQGVVGRAIAWCEETYGTDYRLTIRTDRVDKPLLTRFQSVIGELLGDFVTTTHVTGFDPKTRKIHKGAITVSAKVPPSLRLDSAVANVTLNPDLLPAELALMPDVIANWLAYHFREQNEQCAGISLCSRATLRGLPFASRIYGCAEDASVQPLSETLFRYYHDATP